MSTGAVRFKTIVYRGGLVRFRIPAHWIEEYEHEGGGTFYEEGPDTGTLRLNVLTFEARQVDRVQSTSEFLATYLREQPAAEVIARADENASLAFWKFHEQDEDEPALAIRYWQVANLVLPAHMRMAVFSYTMLRALKDKQRFIAEVQMIDDEVRRCTFAEQLGILPSSDLSESVN
jgi:hypothetical protein